MSHSLNIPPLSAIPKPKRMLDLFAGRLGWSKAFLALGWDCTAIDLVVPPLVPDGVTFFQFDVLTIDSDFLLEYDFVCASSPCEEFSVFGMRHFHPNPPYPEMGLKLFKHTQLICETSGVPYIMENVRAAQEFVGKAARRCGPFFLWGNGIPPLLPQGIAKHKAFRGAPGAYMQRRPVDVPVKEWRNRYQQEAERLAGGRRHCASVAAEIPQELAKCVAEYADAITERQVG